MDPGVTKLLAPPGCDDEDDERTNGIVVRVSGTILFVATLSPSFTLFTLDLRASSSVLVDGWPKDEEEDPRLEEDLPKAQQLQRRRRLDVVMKTNHRASPCGEVRGKSVVEMVHRCAAQQIPVTVYGRPQEPWQICACRPHCPHVILHCDSVVAVVDDDIDSPRMTQQMEVHDDRNPVAEEGGDADDAAAVSVTEDDVMHTEFEFGPIRSTAASAEDMTDRTAAKPTKSNDGPYSETGRRRRTKVRNASRASRFVDALLLERVVTKTTTLGTPNEDNTSSNNNNANSVVLDVAGGGSGAGIAMELSMRRRIPTTVMDPRPVQWNGARRRTLQFRHDARHKLRPGLSLSHQAQVLYERFQPWIVSQLSIRFEDTLEFTRQHDHLLRHCTAIVGLHPDQATEAIVQVALRYQKPWAVVPCCVFPKTFVDRRFLYSHTADDNDNNNNSNAATKPVRTYEELCTYLHTIVPGVQERTLDFEGRNKMYFWIPPSHLSSSTTMINEAGDTVGQQPGNMQSDELAPAAEI